MISFLQELQSSGLLKALVCACLLGYFWRDSKRIVKILITITVAVGLLVFHPGTQLSYVSYLPGLKEYYFDPPGPHVNVQWQRREVPTEGSNKEKLPNIVVIIVDDLGYDDLNGGAGVETPNMNAIASNGVKFTQAYAGHATCSPARASLLTGRYPNRFGFENLAVSATLSFTVSRPNKLVARQPIFHWEHFFDVPPVDKMIIPLDEVMISDLLGGNSSYQTVHIGKWHLGNQPGISMDSRFQEALGFDGAAAIYAWPVEQPHLVNAYLRDDLDAFLWNNLFDFVRYNGSKFPPNEYLTDYFAKQAVNVLKTKLTKPIDPNHQVLPLFMIVNFNAPHTPFQALKTDYDSPELVGLPHKERVYAAMIKSLDRGIGLITSAIKELDQEENTLVIFTSDNGAPGYIEIPGLNKPFRGWKCTFFEGGFRVPMFMSWPGKIPAGMVYDRPVSHVDIFATAAAAGRVSLESLKQERVIDGVDLLPHVQARAAAIASCSNEQQQQCESISYDRNDPHESLFWRTGKYVAFRHGDWKMQVSERPDRVWLSDMVNDPTEQINLAKGLLWSEFEIILNSTGNQIDCVHALDQLMAPRSTEYMHSHDYQLQTCKTGRRLLEVNAEQVKPLWPSLAEVPTNVDKAQAGVRNLEDEYIYWSV